MTKLSLEDFARVCYLVLMQGQDGLMSKHPSYISEKAWMLTAGIDAFAALDIHNMRRVKQWCDAWKVEMPEKPARYLEASEQAAAELEARGVQI